MSFLITPLTENFAGEVSSVDLREPLAKADVDAIESGMDRYAVLIFRDQRLTDEQQVAFSRNFGEIELALGGNVTKPEERRLAVELADVSNLAENDKILDLDDRRVHEWRQHDLIMWDNRQTMHRVRRFRRTEDVRDVRRTTIQGDGPTITDARLN